MSTAHLLRRSALSLILLGGFSPLLAMAGTGVSLMQTAPVRAPGTYEVKLQNDIIFHSQADLGTGYNISPHVVTGIVPNYLDIDAFFGTGSTDFQVGGLAKLNFLPDIEGQVGLSFNFGGSYVRDSGYNAFLATFGVLVSKGLQLENFGMVTPYTSFQLEALVASTSRVPLTIVAGAKWEPSTIVPWAFYTEFEGGFHESLIALALGASYTF